jgi:hypothetical protein
MRTKIITAALIALLCASSGFGQTSVEVWTKYGKPETVYSVSEHVWMFETWNARRLINASGVFTVGRKGGARSSTSPAHTSLPRKDSESPGRAARD